MAYEVDDESTQIRDIEEKITILRDIQYEESESVGEENATGPVYDQQGKFRNNINGISGGGIAFPIDFPEDDRGTVGASTQDILFTDSDRHSVKMIVSGDVNLAFSSPPTNETAYTNIIIVQDGTGGHTVTVPSGTVNKTIVDAGILTGANEETGIVIKFAFGVFYAFLETGNIVSGGSSGATRELDNLQNVAINTSLVSDTTDTDDIGTLAIPWRDAFLSRNLRFGTSGQLHNTEPHVFADASGDMVHNVPTGQEFIYTVNGVNVANLSDGGAEFINNTGVSILDLINRDPTPIDLDLVGQVRFIADDDAGGENLTAYGQINVFMDDVTSTSKGGRMTLQVVEDNILTEYITMNEFSFPTIIRLKRKILFSDLAADPAFNGEMNRNGADVKVFSGGAVRNMSNIGVAAGGANVFLSNLSSPTSVNQNIIPQAGKLLGDSGNPWSSVFSNKISLGTAGTFAASDNAIIADAGTGMEFNTPLGDLYSFYFNNLKRIEFSTSELKFVSGGQFESAGLVLTNAGFDPISNGEFRRNSSDVKVFSGGAVRNLSDIGTGVFLPLAGGTMTGDIIIQDIIPDTDALRSIGSSSIRLLDVWASRLKLDSNVDWALSTGGITGNVGSGDNYILNVNSVSKFQVSGTIIDLKDSVILGVTSGDTITFNGNAGSDLKFNFGNTLDFNSAQSTVGSAGSADTVPTKPDEWIVIKHAGTEFVIPAFAKS